MRDIDVRIKKALAPVEEPSPCLNQRILQKAREETAMKKFGLRRMPAIAAAALTIVLTGGFVADAAWHYFHPDQVAEEIGYQKLAKAFRSKDAVEVNESQSYGDYKITLLGMVAGKNLIELEEGYEGEELARETTYLILAVTNKDGSSFAKSWQDEQNFFISPFIKGEDPAELNVSCMGSGSGQCVLDDVQYCIVECDSLQKFAGRGVYLGVCDQTLIDADDYQKAYHYNSSTGEIKRNRSYRGVNALFKLPFDVSKADEKAADAQIKKWKEDDAFVIERVSGKTD